MTFKSKYKPYLKYHRVVTLVIVFSIIAFTYKYSHSPNAYNNGQIKSYGQTVNGYNTGRWVWYYENGNKQMEGEFNKGKREGTWKIYDWHGNIQSISVYTNDKLNGWQTIYKENKIHRKILFKNDVIISN